MSNFKSKKEYLQFISAWKLATNAEECKSKKVVCDYEEYRWCDRLTDSERERYEANGFTVSDNGKTIKKKDGSHCKDPGWLEAEHYLFYNMMKGRNPKHGFSPVTAKRKLEPGDTVWRGFNSAAWDLHFIVKDAKQFIEETSKGKNPNSGRRSKDFLVPFSGGVSMADLAGVDLDELEQARKVHR